MERVLFASEMKNADSYIINELGIKEEILIERAGLAVANEIIKRFHGGRVLICIGKGNNGEDGKIIAKALACQHGFTVSTLNVFNGIFKMFDNKFDIIVDCIFGTGLNREIEGKYKTAIEFINNSGAYIVSCDIPSGLNADTGYSMGVCVKANLTITIQEYKLGLFLNDGPDYTGEVVVKDIGISVWGENYIEKLNDFDAKKLFTKRKRNCNKGNFGKALIFGGSKNYSGSALLSFNAISAFKMGVGYSALAVPNCLFSTCVGLNPECILYSISDENGCVKYNENDLNKLLKYDCISFGMGVGVSEDNYKIIRFLLNNFNGKLLIDADGLNSLAKYGVDILFEKKCEVILTPHIGEFSRLTGLDKSEILLNPFECSKEFAKKYDIVLLLKNAVSIITDGNKTVINTTGCSALAKGGSGDVLSGICAGLLSRCSDTFDAVSVSAYIFGKAGEMCQKEQNEFTVTASDVIKQLPNVINGL